MLQLQIQYIYISKDDDVYHAFMIDKITSLWYIDILYDTHRRGQRKNFGPIDYIRCYIYIYIYIYMLILQLLNPF